MVFSVLRVVLCLLVFSQVGCCHDLNASIERSLALRGTSFAYEFECGYFIDGILIHEATPRYNQSWWGFATRDRIVIRSGLSPEARMMVFAHERKHYERFEAGLFDRLNWWLEEKIAYEFGWDERNWDSRINRFFCVDGDF